MATLWSLLQTIALVYAFSMTWGVLQERISSQPYYLASPSDDGAGRVPVQAEKFPSFLVLNLLQSTCACFVSYWLVWRMRRSSNPEERHALSSSPPLLSFLPVSLTHTAASPVMYAALSFITYPHVTLISSVKLVPMMAMGWLVNGRRFSGREVACAALMTTGVALYSLQKAMGTGGSADKGLGSNGHTQPDIFATGTLSFLASLSPASLSSYLTSRGYTGLRTAIGVLLVLINLSCDGLVGAQQDRLHAGHRKKASGGSGVPPIYMMYAQNGWASILLAAYLVGEAGVLRVQVQTEGAQGSAGQLLDSLAFMQRHPESIAHALGFALCGTIAQVTIFRALALLGAYTTSTITLSRKFFSILLSTLVYRHTLSAMQWAGIGAVFCGLAGQMANSAQSSRGGQESSRPASGGRSRRAADQGPGGATSPPMPRSSQSSFFGSPPAARQKRRGSDVEDTASLGSVGSEDSSSGYMQASGQGGKGTRQRGGAQRLLQGKGQFYTVSSA